jgi:hypothetical protein
VAGQLAEEYPERYRDYELANGVGLGPWLRQLLERDGLVPTGPPCAEIDDIGRSVLRFRLVPVTTSSPGGGTADESAVGKSA